MADNRRAGERTIFRGNVEVEDTLAEISQALDRERRSPIAAVDAGFVPPAGPPVSNIPAMADLEEELLREFAIYDAPGEAREPPRRVEPGFSAPVAPVTAPEAEQSQTLQDDDDDTMPPLEPFAPFSAARPAPAISRATPIPARVEPEPPQVFEPAADSSINVAADVPFAERSELSVTQAEPLRAEEQSDDIALDRVEANAEEGASDDTSFALEPVFDGPVPDLADFEEPRSEPDLATDMSGDDPVFAGPVPDFDFDDGPAFDGPVPDIAFDEEPAFAGPVPDIDFSEPEMVAEEAPSIDHDLAGELELSVGALDLAPQVTSEPASPFAAWKNDRLSAAMSVEPAARPIWPSSSIVENSIPEAEDVSVAMPHSASEAPQPPVMAPEVTTPAPEEEPLPELASSEIEGVSTDFDFELDPADLLDDAETSVVQAETFETEALPQQTVQTSEPVDAAVSDDAYKAGEEVDADVASIVAPFAPVAAASVAAKPVIDLPDWLQASRRPPADFEPVPSAAPSVPEAVSEPMPAAGAAAAEEDDLFKDFEFNFDDDAIEAEVSRAVMSELQAQKPVDEPVVVEEAPFDPTQINEIEERVPSAFAKMEVPQLPEVEDETVPKPVSDFDYDIEAEMAELFAMGNRSKLLDESQAIEANDGKAEADESFDQGLANEIIRSIHETPAIPAGRAFDIAQMNTGSTSFVSRYARLAAFAALVAFAGVGAILLWRSGDVPGLATDGAPRVIMADKTPVKEVPENPGGKKVPNQDKAVYERVSGNKAENVKQDSLIATAEVPVDVAAKTLGDTSTTEAGQVPGVSADNSDARLPASPSQPAATGQSSNEAIAPRKVKTMIVLPNGTLVARETPAPEEAKPSPTSGNAAEASLLAAPTNEAAASAQSSGTEVATLPQPSDANAGAAAPNTTENKIAAPVPVPRPAEQPVNVVGTVTQRGNVVSPGAAPSEKVASAATKPAAAPAQASSVPAGSYVIQIASLPTQAEAQKSYSNLSGKFASVIGGKPVDIKPAEIPGKGTFYRVRIVAGSKEDAIALCTRYRSAGGSCLVSR